MIRVGVFELGAMTVVPDQTLEERVSAVEKDIAALQAEIESLNSRMAWPSIRVVQELWVPRRSRTGVC